MRAERAACAVVSGASALAAGIEWHAGTITRLAIVTSEYANGAFAAQTRRAAEYPALALPLAASAAGAAFVLFDDRRADGARHGLFAFAVYGVTGGAILVNAVLSATLTFAAWLWGERLILVLALLATVFDGLLSRGPLAGQRALLSASYAALTVGLRVARRLHHRLGLRCAFHHGYQQGLHPQVQVLLDQHRVAHWQARQYLVAGHPRNGLGLRQDRGQGIGRVFAVNQQPVKAGPSTYLGT
jgi:hypothetical protein